MAKIPFPDEENEECRALYEQVGRALSAWEALEWTLAQVFHTFVQTRWIGAERAFGAISASGARMEALKAAAEVHFFYNKQEKLQAGFKLLTQKTSELSGKRTRIAHGMVRLTSLEGYCLGPAWYSSRHIDLPFTDTYSFKADDVNKFSKDFSTCRASWNAWHEVFRNENEALLRKLP